MFSLGLDDHLKRIFSSNSFINHYFKMLLIICNGTTILSTFRISFWIFLVVYEHDAFSTYSLIFCWIRVESLSFCRVLLKYWKGFVLSLKYFWMLFILLKLMLNFYHISLFVIKSLLGKFMISRFSRLLIRLLLFRSINIFWGTGYISSIFIFLLRQNIIYWKFLFSSVNSIYIWLHYG